MSAENLYSVRVTNYALAQLKETVAYIADILAEPMTAQKWLDMMEREMQSLSVMPDRVALTPEEPWHTEGIHRMSVKNFYIYFWVDEEAKDISITAVVYARRNQEEQLKAIETKSTMEASR